MASLTIRNLEEEPEQTLRLRAARNGKSLEEEVRVILRRAAQEDRDKPKRRHANLYDAIRELVEPFGGLNSGIPERSLPRRDPPTFD